MVLLNDSGIFGSRPLLARVWVLATYTLQAAIQGMTWAVPGAVANNYTSDGYTLPSIYGVSGNTVQLLLNYGPIFYLLCAFPVMWSMDRHGIRLTVLSGVLLCVASNVMRCFANDSSLGSLVLIHVSFALNACAGPAAMAVPSKLAEDFFPPTERTLATAVAALGNQSGAAVLYLLIGWAFPNPTRADNFGLNASLAGLSLLNAAMALLYFPSHPPQPPSASARVSLAGEGGITLASLLRSSAAVVRNRTYVVILCAYALSTGLMNCVAAMLPQGLGSLSMDPAFNPQGTAGWVSFAANMGSIVVGVAAAAGTDWAKDGYAGAQKAVLCAGLGASGVSFLAYSCLMVGLAGKGSSGVLWAVAGLYTLASMFQGASIPIMFEICAEQTGVGSSGGGGGGGGGQQREEGLLLSMLLQASGEEREDPEEPASASPGGSGGKDEPIPTGTMLMILTSVSNIVSLVTLLMPNQSFFLWANWAGTAIFCSSALALWALLPATLPRYSFDKREAEKKGESL